MNYLVSGGTGSLGKSLTARLLELGHSVTVYSRDEYKQRKMLADFPTVKYIVGDVRDRDRVIDSFSGIDIVVHAAAIKHVPVGEEMPEEAVKTNILGTMNVIAACKKNKVKKVVFVSTDKACHPVNLYGATKMCAEKLFVSANQDSKTTFVCVRYGNVVGSRGSVIEYIMNEKPKELSVTDVRMTRFWISLSQAVDLVLLAVRKAKRGEIIVPKAPSSNILEMFKWLDPNIKIKPTGMRPGEKLHEFMVSKDESTHTKQLKNYFVIKPELFGVKYSSGFEYNSLNAPRLTKDEFLKLI